MYVTQVEQGFTYNKWSTTQVILNSSTREKNPVSRIAFIIGGQSPWKYQDKNKKKRMEGISLHDQAVWEETCHPLADTFTTWLPPAFRCPVSVSGAGTHSPAHTLPKYSRSSGLEGPEPKHLLFGLRNPRTRETSDVRKSI